VKRRGELVINKPQKFWCCRQRLPRELSSQKPHVVIVTPAHNEEDMLNMVARGLFAQTSLPAEWVIVDDASTDRTFDVAKNLAGDRTWVKAVRHDHKEGNYDASFNAFRFGVDKISAEWDFLVKLDADTTIPADHVERLTARFEADSSLGIASGVNRGEHGIISHPRGNNRMYRKECWEKITFPSDGWGWDTVDEVFARLEGWTTAAFDDIVCEHMRSKLPTPSYRFHQGRLSRHLGYYWWFALGRSVKILVASGLGASAAYFAGYVSGGLGQTEPQVRQRIKEDQTRRIRRILKPRNSTTESHSDARMAEPLSIETVADWP
jgi:glycosyltransferase involved in cell wall biosynthesis